MQIYFIRHGETDYNKAGRLQGRTDILLNDTGKAQALKAHDYFEKKGIKFDRIYSSTLNRAMTTAIIISGCAPEEIHTDERIQEISFGVMEGEVFNTLPEGAMALFRNTPAYVAPQGAETVEELKARCQSFLDELGKDCREAVDTEHVLVATHGATLRGLLSCIEKSALEDFWKDCIFNCTFARVTYEDGIYTLKGIENPVE